LILISGNDVYIKGRSTKIPQEIQKKYRAWQRVVIVSVAKLPYLLQSLMFQVFCGASLLYLALTLGSTPQFRGLAQSVNPSNMRLRWAMGVVAVYVGVVKPVQYFYKQSSQG
jgi:hypothetical protein